VFVVNKKNKGVKMINLNDHLKMLGLKVKDKVTGFSGVVTGVSFDLYGCIQAIVNPGMGKDGKLQEQVWLDVERLEILSPIPVMNPPTFEWVHGPAEKPKMNRF
jgi:hypothetical protein